MAIPLFYGTDLTPYECDNGRGEIYFDGELLRKDDRFVPGDLQGLNVGLQAPSQR